MSELHQQRHFPKGNASLDRPSIFLDGLDKCESGEWSEAILSCIAHSLLVVLCSKCENKLACIIFFFFLYILHKAAHVLSLQLFFLDVSGSLSSTVKKDSILCICIYEIRQLPYAS